MLQKVGPRATRSVVCCLLGVCTPVFFLVLGFKRERLSIHFPGNRLCVLSEVVEWCLVPSINEVAVVLYLARNIFRFLS